MENYLKKLGKDSLVYGIGGIIARAMGFFMLPVYTALFSPSQYGTIEMVSVIIGFLGAFTVMGTDSAQSYYFFSRNEDTYKREIVTSVLQIRIVSGVIICTVVIGGFSILDEFFLKNSVNLTIFSIATMGMLLSCLMNQSTEVFRLQHKPWHYVGVTASNTLLTISGVVFFVVVLDLGIEGYFLGAMVSSMICASVGLMILRSNIKLFLWKYTWWKKIIAFGLPLMPSGLIMWAMNTTDRWVLNYFGSSEFVGIYAIGAKFAMIITVGIEIFRQAWWPVIMEAVQTAEGKNLLRFVSKLYLGIGLALVVFLTAISPFLLRIFISSVFFGGYKVVGLLSGASVLYGFFLISTVSIWKAEKTFWITIGIALGAFFNFVVAVVLVPVYLELGAAIATFFAMVVSNVFFLFIGNRYWNVDFHYSVLLLQFLFATFIICTLLWLYSVFGIMPWIAIIGCLLSLLLVLITLGRPGILFIVQKLRNKGSDDL